jgi:Dolichyl-phosphate-mannose-protein mannosyltransferase
MTVAAGDFEGEPARRSLLVGVVFLAVLVATQWAVGAYRSEQGIYSDDAAHFMNGLLVRDYVAEGLGQNPITFAEQYYASYPKIAPGMWPPFFHITLGLFLLPQWPPHAAALFLLAAIGGWAAWRLYRMVTLFASRPTGLILGLLFLSTPAFVSLTTSVMLDAVVAALALEAVYWLAVFIRSEQVRHAALCGLFTAFCCLTKGNGISLVLAPIVAILLTGRFHLFRRAGLYVAAAIVAVLTVPPLYVTYRLDAAIGDFGPVTLEMAIARLGFYSAYLWKQIGPAAIVLAVIGIASGIWRGRRWQEDASLPIAQALTALLVGALVFHMFNPHLVATGRYITLAIAPVYGLAAVGLVAAGRFIAGRRRHSIQAALLGVLTVTTFFARPAQVVRKPFGYHELVERLHDREGLPGKRILVVSDESGEGAIVTDVAIRKLQPRPTIVRGSKLLGTDNWNGHNFSMRFTSAESIMQELEDLHVTYMVIDSAPEAARLPYWTLVKQLVESHEDRLQLEFHNTLDARNGPTRPLALYRLKYQSPGPPKPFQAELAESVQKLLKR